MHSLRAAGASLQAIADQLNLDGERTIRGGLWSHIAVSRALSVRLPRFSCSVVTRLGGSLVARFLRVGSGVGLIVRIAHPTPHYEPL